MIREARNADNCTISMAVLESSGEEAWRRVPAVAKGRVCQREGRQEDAIITTWFPTSCVSTVRLVYSTLRAATMYYSINPHTNVKVSTYHTRKTIRKLPTKYNTSFISIIVVIEATLLYLYF